MSLARAAPRVRASLPSVRAPAQRRQASTFNPLRTSTGELSTVRVAIATVILAPLVISPVIRIAAGQPSPELKEEVDKTRAALREAAAAKQKEALEKEKARVIG